MKILRTDEKGFTLVELLIVVAIIGILAAIAIPQFSKYKKTAAEGACQSDLRNCMSALTAQYADNSTNTFACAAMDNATVTLDTTSSEITMPAQTPDYDGITVNASIADNAPVCAAQ